MLSIDLFDSKYERCLHEGAVDDAEYARLKNLGEKIDYLKQARAKTKDPEMRRAIDGRIKQYDDERHEILSVRGMKEAEQPQRPAAKGLLKGKDLVTPQQRVAGATPPKPGVAGAVKDVAGGLKRWLKGEPDQGPTYEQADQPGSSPRALGIANFQRIAKANAGFQPTVYFEFIRPEENFKLDQRGIDLISDYYDGLANDQAKNYFIYRVLPSGDETLKILKQLGWTPPTPVQPELPGMPDPIQGELPLNEKKKSQEQDDIKAGDVKVARELQKLRAQYPAARSDVEAVARAEIDSSERSAQQIAAIRGANEKQDALLKQLVALDQEQGREINNLDQENNTLEKQLAKVQSTNDRLQQAIGQMTGTKKSSRPAQPNKKTIDLIPGAPADVKLQTKFQPQTEPEPEPTTSKGTSPAIATMAKQIQGLTKPAPVIRPAIPANEPQAQAVAEHGGGIGPRQHWQDLMPEQSNPEDDDWYDDEDDQETDLRSGDYVRDTMDGEHGEIFRMQGDPYERRVRILDRDGKGWYIEPSRLTRVDPQDPDVQRYFGKHRQRDMDESGMAESYERGSKVQHPKYGAGQVVKVYPNGMITVNFPNYPDPIDKKPGAQGNFMPGDGDYQSLKSGMAEGWSDAMVVRRTGGARTPYSVYIKGKKWKDFENDDLARAVMDRLKAKFKAAGRDPETITIAPTDITEEALIEGIRDTSAATAVIACLLTGGSLTGCATAPQKTTAQQVLKTGQDVGRTVQAAKNITRAGVEAEVNQEIRNLLRGIGGRPEELNNSNILRIWRKVKGAPPVQPEPQAPEYGPAPPVKRTPQYEAKEIHTREEFVRERDRLLRMITQETNPANKQILRSAIRQLENRAENEGWIAMQQRMIRESNASGDAEQAILKRIMVAHTDLLKQYGPQKVMQAVEEVAYNVGDLDEIGSSDVSGWVKQVQQILGATA